MQKVNILIVDDEWNMRNLLKHFLHKENWNIEEASSGIEALDKINKGNYHLVILDVMMPELNGWEVCSRVREQSNVPILLLTARNETRDKVQGLNLGADDYLTKPFDKEELVARINALLRRVMVDRQKVMEESINIGDISIKSASREVFVNGGQVTLTPKEFDVLYILAKNPNRAFSREVLLEQVWGHDFLGDFRTVDQHIKNIRDKVKKAGCSFNPIQTVWGLGYKLQGKDDQ